MPTQLENVKEALAQIGTRSSITALNDGSPEANYATLLYGPLRDFLLTEGDYDFSMSLATAVPSATAPAFPWTYAYDYPASCLRLRQVIPVIPNGSDPRPFEWNVVAFNSTTKRIWTKEEAGRIVYTQVVGEGIWNGLFQQSFVRLLASALAFSLENRIEASAAKLNEALSFAGIANLRDM